MLGTGFGQRRFQILSSVVWGIKEASIYTAVEECRNQKRLERTLTKMVTDGG